MSEKPLISNNPIINNIYTKFIDSLTRQEGLSEITVEGVQDLLHEGVKGQKVKVVEILKKGAKPAQPHHEDTNTEN